MNKSNKNSCFYKAYYLILVDCYVFYVSLPTFEMQKLYPYIFIFLVPGTYELDKSLLDEYLYFGSPAESLQKQKSQL